MTATIRPAGLADLEPLLDLLIADAESRHAADPGLWRMKAGAREAVRAAVDAALRAEAPAFRQFWLIAESRGRAVGLAHAILLPVPPIYAGAFGAPGLIMEDCALAEDAPEGTRQQLLLTAERDLIAAGARILLASSIVGGPWEADYARQGYTPLTLYLAKTGLEGSALEGTSAPATEADLPGIIAASAQHRRILEALHPQFWKPHEEADARFGAWMRRSLTLPDRDMFVARAGDHVTGYAISQPATALHFPPSHEISGIGVIDDFFHEAIGDLLQLAPTAPAAIAVFRAAEAARASRGAHSVMVVCPADWYSKITLLEAMGYRKAILWHIKMVGETSGAPAD